MKLTPKQREVLALLADGWELTWMCGTRCDPYAFARRDSVGHRTVRVDYVYKFRKAGWIEMFSDKDWAWRSADYRITEAGRKALA